MDDVVTTKLKELETRVRSLESKAVAGFVRAESWIGRNAFWFVPVVMVGSFLIGHFGR